MGLRGCLKLIAVIAAISAAGTLSACAPSAPSSRYPAEDAHPLTWGVFVPQGDRHDQELGVVETMIESAPGYVLSFAALAEEAPLARLTQIADDGATPILSLEPWIPDGGIDQPAYALDRINAGDHDADIRRWAESLAGWGRPVLLRFAHEMNGNWYPWAVGVGGNTPGAYIAAWNRVHDAFAAAGAENVSFVWSPNIPSSFSTTDYASVFPGRDKVDILGIDGYNQQGNGHVWQTPEETFGGGLDELRALDPALPILVTETASSEGARLGVDKAEWITGLVDYLAHAERVTGFVWFQVDKEQDWRFNSTREAELAMRKALHDWAGGD